MARGVDMLVATPGRLHRPPRPARSRRSRRRRDPRPRRGRPDARHGLHPPASGRSWRSCRSERQSLFFSATMPKEIGAARRRAAARSRPRLRHARRHHRRPRAARASSSSSRSRKPRCWSSCSPIRPSTRALVFTRTKHGADKVARHLEAAGISAAAIHGNKSQRQRERALDGLPRRPHPRCSSRPTSPPAASTSTA